MTAEQRRRRFERLTGIDTCGLDRRQARRLMRRSRRFSPALVDVLGVDVVVSAHLTCDAVPVQIEGRLTDGRHFYFRYRWGRAGVGIAATPHDAVRDQCGEVEHGGPYSGFLERDSELAEVFARAWDARSARA